MFHSAALKLTAWYLAIIMALSIGCSIAIYHFSSNEIGRNEQGQVYFLNNDLPTPDFRSFATFRTQQVSESRGRLKGDLIFFNLLVLAAGGAVSYLLARRTMEPIEEALESQKRFAADASHELRTPLTAMQSEIEVALRDPKINKSEAIDQLKSNLEEVAKLKNLSEGLLKLASSNGVADLKEVVKLKDILPQASDRLAKTAGAKKISVKILSSGGQVVGDRQNLTDLVAILLDNAIKYSPSGSEVTLSSGTSRKQAYIKVSDKGQGISSDDLPHIFDRFYRADVSRSKSNNEGYGLGLALARKIVELHGGYIEVHSTAGQGSAFSVYLPAA